MNEIIIWIGLAVLCFLLIFVLVGLYNLQKQNKSIETERKIDLFAKDFQNQREARSREMDVLREQMYKQTESLQKQFDRVNKTVDTKLTESSKQLNDRLDKSSQVIGVLSRELGKMSEMGARIENLDKILRAPKGRGNLGEESLEEILKSVFPVNLWQRQYNLGAGLIVDAVVKTTNGIIPIDAKYPLEAYERMVHSETADQQDKARKEFQRDVKNRIDEVAKYIQPQKETVNFAVLFLPNESIYYEAQVRDMVISEYAKKKHVLITGPNTMLYALQVVFQAYQSQEFAKEAQKALSHLKGVKKVAEKLDADLTITEKHLHNATTKLNESKKTNMKLQNQIDDVVAIDVSTSVKQESLL